MDKTECRAVIELFVKEGLTANEIHSKFKKRFMGTLLLRFQQLRNGLPSLNVSVPAGIKVLVLREIMLKSKNYFEIINSFFHCFIHFRAHSYICMTKVPALYGSSVGIATGYELDGPRVESR
jgi:hypothetical protein